MRHIGFFFLAFVLMWHAGAAMAGPWPREAKAVFMSLSSEIDRDSNSYTSLYSEYGLSARNTLGFELGHSNADETTALLWWQRALGGGDGPNHWSMSSGIGAVWRDGSTIPLAQMGGAWGRGFDSVPMLKRVPGGGWLAAELRMTLAGHMKDEDEIAALSADDAGMLSYITTETTTKLEMTMGWHARSSLMLINQMRFEKRDGVDFSGKLAVSAVQDIWGPAKIELGIIAPLTGPGEMAVKLGTWIEF